MAEETKFADRVAAQAASVRVVRMLLTAVAAVFYAIGFVIGVGVLCVRWSIGAVKVGVADAKARTAKPGGGT